MPVIPPLPIIFLKRHFDVAGLRNLPVSACVMLGMLVMIGLCMLYSAAQGSFTPWALRQTLRAGLGLTVMLAVACLSVRFWYAYAYSIYIGVLVLLILVEVMGSIGMGAQRWVDLYIFNLQPSELMRIALPLALARYFYNCSFDQIQTARMLIVPLLLTMVPVALALRQPDLGTAMMLLLSSTALFFVSGVPWRKFAAVAAGGLAAAPLLWNMLHPYQQRRILVFLNPEFDPMRSGYHILQSKIALGSGGITGKGFLQGSQSQLSFLPEKQTDFIFAMFAEECGFIGSIILLLLFGGLIAYGMGVALRCRSYYARLVSIGLTVTFFLYVFINIAMVTGLVPVVGIPLPFLSYGGTAMITLMFSMGILFACDLEIKKRG